MWWSYTKKYRRTACRQDACGGIQDPGSAGTTREDKTVAQLCQELNLHALQITECKRHFLEHTINVSGDADQINQEDL